ncbi:MAG: tetratricopeptide repeat protein [Methylomonas sp.]
MISLTGCGMLALTNAEPGFPEPPPAPPVAETKTFTAPKNCGGEFTAEQRMYLELVHKMVEQEQFYGAIANLDQLEKSALPSPQTIYLRAEALRRSGQLAPAEKQYNLLLNGCMAGYGLHGLGLLATESGQLAQAQDFLERACQERPVDAHAHNDLGMVLLLRGNHQDARKEFMTAMELDRTSRLPLENLLVLMLVAKQDTQAEQFAAAHGLNAQDRERLAQRAAQLQKPQLSENLSQQ